MELTVEAGKRYVRRNGSITPPLVKAGYDAAWVSDPYTGMDYDTKDSKEGWMVFPGHADHEYDLMEESV